MGHWSCLHTYFLLHKRQLDEAFGASMENAVESGVSCLFILNRVGDDERAKRNPQEITLKKCLLPFITFVVTCKVTQNTNRCALRLYVCFFNVFQGF